MPKYWLKNYFAHGRFSEVGQKQWPSYARMAHASRLGQKKGLNDGDNNGQATHGHCYQKKAIFRTFFLLFTASVRSRPPGPPAVPGVLFIFIFSTKLKSSL